MSGAWWPWSAGLSLDNPMLLLLAAMALWPLLGFGYRRQSIPALDPLPADRLSSLLDWTLRGLGALAVVALVLASPGCMARARRASWWGMAPIRWWCWTAACRWMTPMGRPRRWSTSGSSGRKRPRWRSKWCRRFSIIASMIGSASLRSPPPPFWRCPSPPSDTRCRPSLNAMKRRALDRTNIGEGLQLALGELAKAPPIATKVILFVSDGAGIIPPLVKRSIRVEATRLGVHLYYLYLRNPRDPHLDDPLPESAPDAPALLHQFFTSLNLPYRAFEADSSAALADAFAAIDAQETEPLPYTEAGPRRDYDALCYGVAAGALAVLFGARLLERRGATVMAPL